jgi:putative ABC transport system substrate-binding protein
MAMGIDRRRLIVGLGSAAAWPLAVRAQQAGKLPIIGFLGADASAFSPWTAAFVARLRELGWIEGSTVAIEYRWSQGRTERYAGSQPSLSISRLTSLSQSGAPSPLSGKRQRLSPLSSQWQSTRSVAA